MYIFRQVNICFQIVFAITSPRFEFIDDVSGFALSKHFLDVTCNRIMLKPLCWHSLLDLLT